VSCFPVLRLTSKEALVKFATKLDWSKYIDDADVQKNLKRIQDRVSELAGSTKGGDAGGEDDEGDIDISGATRVKLVVVGDGAVGKTSLLISYATGEFPVEYVPTVFENYTARKKHGSQNILLHLWDTAGQEEYDRLRPLSYPGADIVLLCFSTISQASYDAIREKWHPEVNHYIPDVPSLLVGTKIDMRDAKGEDVSEPVSKQMGEKLAKEIESEEYLECSAKTTQGLAEIFEKAVDIVLTIRGEGTAEPAASGSKGSDDKPKTKVQQKAEAKKNKNRRCSLL
jgi:small GTP-binding protein